MYLPLTAVTVLSCMAVVCLSYIVVCHHRSDVTGRILYYPCLQFESCLTGDDLVVSPSVTHFGHSP